jgi:ribosomal protein S18 acetylase RimI-like enzyme
MKIEIRVLNKDDDTSTFDCDTSELNQFLKQYAKQNQFKHYIGTTYVLIFEDKIVGYVSVSASSIRIDELSLVTDKKLPNYPLPILRLTRLAVDKNYQKSGFGKMLLRFVFELTLKQKEQFGCFGLIVDAKRPSVSFYEQFGFKSIEVIAGVLDVRPFAQSMFIATKVLYKSR